MANIINLTADTTVDIDRFRATLFSTMDHVVEWAFKDFAYKDTSYERIAAIMGASSDMCKYLFGVQALLFAIPEYEMLSSHGQLAYNEMKEAIEEVSRELAELANEIKL